MEAVALPSAARTPTERRWLYACLAVWLLLLPLSAWLGLQQAFSWKLLASPVDALAGAFGAVVIGGFILQKWQKRVEAEREAAHKQDWMRRNLGYVLEAQDEIRAVLAEIAVASYAALSVLVPEGERIP